MSTSTSRAGSNALGAEDPSALPRMVVLANTKSTRCPDDLDALVKPLRARFAVQVIRVDHPPDFSERIAEAANEAGVLVVGSGDGTLARSGNALIESGRVLGVLPFGNANDLARGLGMPLEIEAACQALLEAQPVAVDVGRVNGHCFFNAATLGIGAQISSGMDAATKRRWKRFSQIPNLFTAIQDRRSFRLTLHTARGRQSLRSIHVNVANGRTIGGGIVVDEAAALDDAKLDFSSVRPQTWTQLLGLAPAMISGKRKDHPRVDFMSEPWLRIESARRLDIATDGDVITQTPAQFECLPAAVRFLVPRNPTQRVAVALDPPPNDSPRA